MKNGIAKLLKVIAIITLIAGIICTIWGLTDIWNIAFLYVGIGGLISAVFIRGFAEVIELLQEIKDNTEMQSSKGTSDNSIESKHMLQQAAEPKGNEAKEKVKPEEEKQKRLEEQRRQEEEQKRLEEQHRQEEAQQELEERKEKIFNALEKDQKTLFSGSIGERQKLITDIAYAMNMISPNKQRAKLKQINMESAKGIIDFLLSLSDDELKPVANNIMKQLKDGA